MIVNTWQIFPFQGASDYWRSINATLESDGKVTVNNKGKYYYEYNIPLTADTAEDSVTEWQAKVCYTTNTGVYEASHVIKSITDDYELKYSGNVNLDIGSQIWIKLMVTTNSPTNDIDAGGEGTYYTGIRSGE